MPMEIWVRKLGEGDDAWAAVPAQEWVLNSYLTLDNDVEEREDCTLEFKPGQMVTAMEFRNDEGGGFLGSMRLDGGVPLV